MIQQTLKGPLPREMGDTRVIFVPAGTLDDEPNIKPQARIFQNSNIFFYYTQVWS